MKCLSLWQPWASLMVHRQKLVETRSWSLSYRGPLLIHAAQHWTQELVNLCRRDEVIRQALASIGEMSWSSGARQKTPRPQLPFGAIVGLVEVVGCVPTEEVSVDSTMPTGAWHLRSVAAEQEKRVARLAISVVEHGLGDYTAGRYAITCTMPRIFAKPVPYRGSQGVFDVPESVVKEQLAT